MRDPQKRATRRPRAARHPAAPVASIRPYGRSAAMNTSPGFSSPNGERSTMKWCLLGADEPHLDDARDTPRARPPHVPERLLQRERLQGRELADHDRLHLADRPRSSRRRSMRSATSRRGRSPSPGRAVSGRVVYSSLRKPANSRPGRLEDDQVLEAADDVLARGIHRDGGGAHLLARGASRCGRARRRRRRRAARRTPRSRCGRPRPARRRARSAARARARTPRSSRRPTDFAKANAVFFWVSVGSTFDWSPTR